MKIALIGCGKLGSAFARCFLKTELAAKEELIIFEKDDKLRALLKEEFQCSVIPLPSEELTTAEVVMIAVRPQDFSAAAAEVITHLWPDQAVVSVMAGVKIAAVFQELNSHTQLARCMPNLPVQVGEGIIPYAAHPELTDKNKSKIQQLLQTSGETIELQDESLLDAVTAVSGSGPGYLFTVFEQMVHAACEIGFTREEAETLVKHTAKGTASMWLQSNTSIEDLKESMRLKGGTTEAAYEVLESRDFGHILIGAIKTAYTRAQELGKG